MLFESGSGWRWRPGTNEASSPLNSWREPGFNDREFSAASAPFWYGDPYTGGTLIQGMQNNYLSIFLRKTFVVTNVAEIASLQLAAVVDDGFVAWINGAEVQRVNMPEPPGSPVTISTLANNAAEPVSYVTYELPPPSNYAVLGTNVIAVQVFQSSLGSSDLGFDCSLEAILRDPPLTNVPPVVAATVPPAGATVRSLGEVTILFNKSVAGVNASDLLINNLPASEVTAVTPSQYSFRFVEPPPGRVNFGWAASQTIHDLDMTPKPFAGGTWSYQLDPNALDASPYISEFMASNTRTLADENGDFPDWIEIYNPSTGTISLDGWFLTDSTNNLNKWRFPAINLPASRFLVVFASEKDRRNVVGPLHTNFRLSAEGEYLALVKSDGVTVASQFTFPGQVADVSFGIPQLGEPPNLSAGSNAVYFTLPTPGALNGGGTDAPGPSILEVHHTPNVPLENDDLVVTARVSQSFYTVASVTMRYRVMFGSEVALPMFDDGQHNDGAANDGIFGATIPASASSVGQMVRYYIFASDVNGRSSRWPLFTDPVGTAQYLGTVIQPGYVTSNLPVIHLFAQPTVLQPGPNTSSTAADSQAGSSGVSVFYDGEFYDNIYVAVRGNTTAGYPKKSHRFEFNREHPFRHPGVGYGWPEKPGPRLRKTSFVADYPDPTYMRQGLSFWLCDQLGSPASFYYPVRLQLNGQFYQLANHNDVHGEELLDRLGYDPNGALYNAAGTIQPSQASTGGFEKKTRTWEGNTDYQQLANGIAETLSIGARRTNVFEMFDLPNVIDYLVAARFAQENDDVWANMSIYHDNDGDNLWRIVSFDMNLSWGAFYMDNAANDQGIQATNDNHKSFPLYGSSQALSLTGSTYNRIYDVIFDVPETLEMFRRRMRTMLDTFVLPPGSASNSSPVEQKILAWRDRIIPDATIDRAKWGWPGIGGQNNLPPASVADGVDDLLQQFFYPRRQHFYGKHSVTNLTLPVGSAKTQNAGFPLPQPADAVINVVAVDFNPASGNQEHEYICLTNPTTLALDISGWKLAGAVDFTFAPGTVIPSSSAFYVSPNVRAFRARTVSPRGREGRLVLGPYKGQLSARGETITVLGSSSNLLSSFTYAGAPSPAQQFLRISEIMFHPATAGTNISSEEYEFIELRNISTNVTLDLTGVRLTNGIAFDFTGGAVTSLGPQGSVLLVKNLAAFTQRYGTGLPVAGQYSGSLDNSGERLRLIDGAGEEILDFVYNNAWYPPTDGAGYSLVIVDENAEPDLWSDKLNWRPSVELNGSPGTVSSVVAPVVIQHPVSQTVVPGGLVVLSVAVTNTATLPITFQIERNGVPLAETTSTLNGLVAFYSVTNADPSFTNYTFRISNAATPAGALSEPAILTFLSDSDQDGLPDQWETQFGLDPNRPDATLDPDGDAMTNLAEYIAGTDPTTSSSAMKLTARGTSSGVDLEFLAVAARTYSIEFTDSLGTASWQKLTDLAAIPVNRLTALHDNNPKAPRFYRLVTPRRP